MVHQLLLMRVSGSKSQAEVSISCKTFQVTRLANAWGNRHWSNSITCEAKVFSMNPKYPLTLLGSAGWNCSLTGHTAQWLRKCSYSLASATALVVDLECDDRRDFPSPWPYLFRWRALGRGFCPTLLQKYISQLVTTKVPWSKEWKWHF